jgi:GxxExxY protein
MRLVFDAHNFTGCFCSERIQRREVEHRLSQTKLGAIHSELPITVTWRGFKKHYYLDLLVADGAVYELKATNGLNEGHRAQLLNYLLLLELSHGKLLNFRTASVEWEYVTTRLTKSQRRHFVISENAWQPLSDQCLRLKQVLAELLTDWGAFLELSLYQETLVWALGGETEVLRRVPLSHGGVELGDQTLPLVTPDIAFKLTAYSAGLHGVESHWRRLLALTPLRALHWINMHQHDIQFVTLLQS